MSPFEKGYAAGRKPTSRFPNGEGPDARIIRDGWNAGRDDLIEIQALERKYPRRFLRKALSASAIRYRELTAPNRANWMAHGYTIPT